MSKSKNLTVEDIATIEGFVAGFNYVFGNSPDDESLIEVYKNLTIEELKECVTAEKENDLVEELDGLCDVCFTGLFLNRLVQKYHLYEEEEEFLEMVVDRKFNVLSWEELLHILQEEDNVQDFVANFLAKLVDLADKFDIMQGFKRVYQSNMSKCICKNDVISGLISLQACVDEVESAGRYSDLFWEETETHFILKAKNDLKEEKFYESGKIVKIESLYSSVQDLGGLKEFVL